MEIMDRRNLINRALARRLRPFAVALLAGGLALPGSAGADEVGAPDAGPLTLASARSYSYSAPGQILLPAATSAEDAMQQLDLERGKSLFVRTDYTVKRVSVGNPDVLDVVVLSTRELQFVAKKIGATNVVLWDPSGAPQAAIDVHVGTPHSQVESELQRVLGNPDIKVDSAGSSIVLKGTVATTVELEKALAVANGFFAESEGHVINLLDVGGNHQVMLEVIVAEMSRRLGREFGTNFRVFIESDGKTFEFLNLLSGMSSPSGNPLDPALQLAEQVNLVGAFTNAGDVYQFFFDMLHEKGMGKVLAEPTLVARSGETANFLAGGEVPIPIAQGGAFGSITIQYKAFGVGVAFTPTVLGDDRINLRVAPEVSEPDFTIGTAVGGVLAPGFRTRRSNTTIELADGQSFAIAGLLSDTVRESVSQYPVLGEIPVLGALFRSSQFQKNETELVMIVTPHLVKPLDPGPPHLPTDYFVEPNALEFYFLGRLEGRAGRGDTESAALEEGGLIGDAGHEVAAAPEGEL